RDCHIPGSGTRLRKSPMVAQLLRTALALEFLQPRRNLHLGEAHERRGQTLIELDGKIGDAARSGCEGGEQLLFALAPMGQRLFQYRAGTNGRAAVRWQTQPG